MVLSALSSTEAEEHVRLAAERFHTAAVACCLFRSSESLFVEAMDVATSNGLIGWSSRMNVAFVCSFVIDPVDI